MAHGPTHKRPPSPSLFLRLYLQDPSLGRARTHARPGEAELKELGAMAALFVLLAALDWLADGRTDGPKTADRHTYTHIHTHGQPDRVRTNTYHARVEM